MDDTAARMKGGDPPPPDRPGDEIAGRDSEAMRGYATDTPPAGSTGAAPPIGGERFARDRSGQPAQEGEPDTSRIRADIQRTREDMAETIDAIQERLRPGNVLADARDRVRSSATSRLRSIAESAGEGAQAMMQHTRGTRDRLTERAGQNPIPIALIGIGAAWLLWNRSRSEQRRHQRVDRDWPGRYREALAYEDFDELDDTGAYPAYDYDTDADAWREEYREAYALSRKRSWGSGVMRRITEHPVPTALAAAGLAWLAFPGDDAGRFERIRAERDWQRADEADARGSATSRTGESAAALAERAQDATRQVAERAKGYARGATRRMRLHGRRGPSGLQRLMHRNPLLVGAGAFVLGTAVGLLLPETERENEWMGEARDQMLERAQARAREAARSVASGAKEVAGEAVGKLASEVTGTSQQPGPTRPGSQS